MTQLILATTILTLLASASPLLTFVHLWQLKEWRIDRLRTHLDETGWWHQLFGKIRPPLTLILFVFSGFHVLGNTMPAELACIFVLASLSAAQIVLRKQPLPVWTAKALMISGVSFVMLGGATLALNFSAGSDVQTLTLLVPVLAPVFVLISWSVLLPVDMFLKNRTFTNARRLRSSHKNLTVIGITGSVGKTTTKELLSHILKSRGAYSTPAHVNTEMGVARWLASVLRKESADSNRILIVEMGAYKKGEIALLCSIAQPQMGIITYIGDQHISLFGSREAITEGKGELFASLPSHGYAFVNRDNDAADALIARCRCKVTTVGTSIADYQALDVEETPRGLSFTAKGQRFEVPIAGTHSITSILLAVAAAATLGLTLEQISQSLKNFTSMNRTFEVKIKNGVTLLDDTYNSSPESLRAAIDWAKDQPHATKTLVIDGIIELGGREAEIHMNLAKRAEEVFDDVFVVQDRFLPYFTDVFGNHALPANKARPVPKDSLLVCCGRMPSWVIEKFTTV